MDHSVSSRPFNTRGRNDLAYKLFIELLSYQLASPVRWIETQDELLKAKTAICRFIEVGPRTTLANMARKSAAIHHKSHAPSQWAHLQFLSYMDDKAGIMYEYQKASPLVQPKSENISVPANIRAQKQETRVPEASPPASPTSTAITSYGPSKDVVLSARHITLAMTAQKLRRPFDRVPMIKTIRDLSGGKSTLQNELTGDLVAEFGRVPDGVEDMSLTALGEALQGGFSGKPGKQMSMLISKFVSSKLPAGFNQVAMQDFLQLKWGLDKPHSTILICFATAMEPASRLSGADEVRSYLDGLVEQYAAFEGIAFVPTGAQGGSASSSSSTAMMSSAEFESLKNEHKKLFQKQFKVLEAYLQSGEQTLDVDTTQITNRSQAMEKSLQQWNAELDDQFLDCVKPMFNLNKARQYDSWWNWVREDVFRWLNEISASHIDTALLSVDDRLRRIFNRWEPSCVDIIRAHLGTSWSEQVITSTLPHVGNKQAILYEMLRLGARAQLADPIFIHTQLPMGPRTMISASGQREYDEIPRNICNYPDVVRQGRTSTAAGLNTIPFVHLRKRRDEQDWLYDPAATEILHTALDTGVTTGLTYAGKSVLVTGGGPDSIGAHVVQGLLAGGAKVIVTTSRAVSSSATFFQGAFRTHGSRGASLTLLPFNQASKNDCEALIQYVYSKDSPVGGDLDYIVPFAAIPQAGELDSIGDRQEVALRAMLVNILRLIGFVRREKEKRRIDTRPTTVILPMSCNEGTFGGDGLYAEAKIGLKTLFNRFHSETWSTYINVCGAVIGWTRGTGLMRSTNALAAEMEKLGVITFTQAEMALNILALLTPSVTTLAEEAPIYADLTGGLGSMWNVKEQIACCRKKLSNEHQLRNALMREDGHHQIAVQGKTPLYQQREALVQRKRANLKIGFPPLTTHHDMISGLPDLLDMVDLSRTVVVVGFSELGPWGNAHTRWEMESQGHFSLEGYIEIVWIMGLIQHIDGEVEGQPYVGWVDAETREPVQDEDIPTRYGNCISKGTGLRLIEPSELDSYDPSRKEFIQEVAIEDDLPPFESSKSAAEAFKLRHGDKVSIQSIPGSDEYRVFIKKGATLMIPKSIPFDQIVGGRVPKGWNPSRYGIPEDIVQQVDRTTLYALCCVSEAFLSAGIKDPYEIYQHIHPSEMTNCLGTGGGPGKAIQSMYRDRYLDRPIRGDIILDHFANTMGAWVNMLLLSSTGPLKTPVGACATAIESLDSGCEAIMTGKCKMALVGGCDDYGEEVAYEFANIKATANSAEELAKDRLPSEISRPTASSRSGFAEAAGCGVQILTSAEVALEMGLPIYGVVAYNQLASDQIGRSIPAPGKGILTAAREGIRAQSSPLLDFGFRRSCFDQEVACIQQHYSEQKHTQDYPSSESVEPQVGQARMEQIMKSRIRDAQQRWANNIRLQDSSISPVRAALAAWGLTIDDIGLVSMHGTSTKANEINEGDVINTQMHHLGRRKGNPLLCVCQKSLTGHPKGAAGAWQLNGCMQIFRDGIVPGNRNADNVDEQLRKFEYLLYPMSPLPISEVKATMLTSFGFGQKGAINVLVAPRYLFASLSTEVFEKYRTQVNRRQRTATKEYISRLLKNTMVQVKNTAPWKDSHDMRDVFLNQNSRLAKDYSRFVDSASNCSPSVQIPSPEVTSTADRSKRVSAIVQSMVEDVTRRAEAASSVTVGVDVEEIASINIENENYIDRNFTWREREYCRKAPNPRASYAGRWSAKEAVFKSLQTPSRGAGVSMNEIEIVNTNGIPSVTLHGNAHAVAASKGISNIEVTISHASDTVVAVALATGEAEGARF
ncbi:uncharacterized protein BP01DRAFT_300379 [Aspergillus saccharolyticus JOP 1030-1]|uniref:Fatty acid synthase subunit alpha n=1 Tax=Aspergillus saccharolyticus JOP 1030-1 TaxID=1450539 RepID=A0A318Z8Z0_9EURO|nr:hypothetical protein BP01DRAFT_300379 [Aspergillus saccharolyticus JOP 1030-1]PYH43659.1 hypothetical protein BP01DRAFT_300379 [Aspergillus saccharolyticus JOP 1030-1]